MDVRPMGPFRGHITKSLVPITLREISKAMNNMARGKAPGPDGYLVELYRNATVLHRALETVRNAVMRTGRLPRSLRRLYIVPLIKRGKDPAERASLIPISLIGSAVKILESVLYHRMLLGVEP